MGVAHAQSDLWAQQSSSVLRDSSTLRVCAILPYLLFCTVFFIPVVFIRKHSISNMFPQVTMQKRNLMKMRTMFPQKTGKRSAQSLFT